MFLPPRTRGVWDVRERKTYPRFAIMKEKCPPWPFLRRMNVILFLKRINAKSCPKNI